MDDAGLKSFQFRHERQASWQRLEELVQRAERSRNVRGLAPEDLSDLPRLYRQAVSSLSLARAISLDRNLVEYLEALTLRAYFCVYGTRRHPFAVVGEFVRWGFPSAVRRYRNHMLLAWSLFLIGGLTSWVLTARDPEWFYSFVDADLASGRDPTASTETLRSTLFQASASGGFATMLFTHNAQIGIWSFALGFAGGIITLYLMFTNGLMLGAFGALFMSRGLSVEFWGWVLPHGVTEILAIILCGGAGLVLGQALVFPGRMSRVDNLLVAGREAGRVATGAMVMFLIAGVMEGVFRGAVTSTSVRWTVALAFACAWYLYLGVRPMRRAA